MKVNLQVFLFISLVLISSVSSARVAISAASGYGVNNTVVGKVGLQIKWDRLWRPNCLWQSTGYWEASYYRLEGKRQLPSDKHKNLNAGAFAAVFRFFRSEPIYGVSPYWDIGVGASLVSRLEYTGRRLGIHYQFEDRFGIGFQWGDRKQYDLGYRFVHFSNANLGEFNNGINLQLFVFSYWI